MSKLATLLVVVLVGAGVLFTTSTSWAVISGTAHDFSAKGWGTQEKCIFCHTPHNAKTPQLAPLWNHASTTQTGWTMYDSATLDGPIQSSPQGVSKACLSCHDGSVAVDSYGSRTGVDANKIGGVGGDYETSTALVGTDLTDDHPISITYAGGAAGDWNSPPNNSLPLYGTGANQVECGSCHNPHDNQYTKFLRISNTGSALCLSCHVK